PAAVLAPACDLNVPIRDLSSLPAPMRESESNRLMAEEARTPFDLGQSPLLRATLLRLGSEQHVLLLTTHHIACDGWSLGLFYRELATLYEAFARGGPSPLAELAINYADFARWQRERLQGEILETQLRYWTEQLAGAQTALDLPADRPRPPLQTYRGTLQFFRLKNDLSALKWLA